MLPPRIVRAKGAPARTTLGSPPISRSRVGAKKPPIKARIVESRTPSRIACAAAVEAPSGSCSPVRRAMVAVVAMLRPTASAYRVTTRDSVRATAATESVPRLETKNASTMANSDSIDISRTMGMASRRIARSRLSSV